MLKPAAAGLMCLGFVTLGVAMSRGQNSSRGQEYNLGTDLIVIDGELSATEVTVDDAQESSPVGVIVQADETTVEVSIGEDGDANVNPDGQTLRVIRIENGDVVVSNEDDRIVEKYRAGSEPTRRSARVARMPQVIDPQTREMLDKVTAGLKDEIEKLKKAGKEEEAQQKVQSLRAIESLLHGNPRDAGIRFVQRFRAPKQTMEEMKALHSRLKQLVDQSSNLPQGAADEGDKLRQEIEKVKKDIAEKHQSLTAPAPVGGQPPQFGQFGPGQPFLPGMAPPHFGQQPPGGPRFHGGSARGFRGQPPRHDSPESIALSQKADALAHAAARLKESGLVAQAEPLEVQAEQFRAEAEQLRHAEAEKHRAQAGAGAGAGGRGGFGGGGGPGPGEFGGGGPPMDLHRSIHELQEQIQQLRKEVGELRELLQRRH